MDPGQGSTLRPSIIRRPELLPVQLFGTKIVFRVFVRICVEVLEKFRTLDAAALGASVSDTNPEPWTITEARTASSFVTVVVERQEKVVVAFDRRRPEPDSPLIRQEGSEGYERIGRRPFPESRRRKIFDLDREVDRLQVESDPRRVGVGQVAQIRRNPSIRWTDWR